jgi:uncharacterized protein with NRDE domain
MNRDESRLRHESDFNKEVSMLYPTDSLAGGTWFGSNHSGLVIALLNRYQAHNPHGYKSRGLLIPSFLNHWSSAEMIHNLSAQSLRDYNPFDLIASDNKQTWHLSWDGNTVITVQQTEDFFAFSSSGIDTKNTIAHRISLFKQWQGSLDEKVDVFSMANSVLHQFHLYQCIGAEKKSVLMDRDEAHTKSICQVIINAGKVDFSYYPETTLTNYRKTKRLKENPPLQGLCYQLTLDNGETIYA